MKDFPVFHTALTVSRLGVRKKVGGDTVGTGDQNWPKRCPIPYGVMLNNETGGSWPAAGGLHGHQSAGGDQLHYASLLFCIFLSFILSSFLFYPVKLSSSQLTSFTFFTVLSPTPLGSRGVKEPLCGD